MKSKASSFFLLGAMVGVLITTACIAMLMRRRPAPVAASLTPTVLKLAHTLDEKHPVHRAMQHMADRASERSNGLIQIQIFPNGQLGSEKECLEQLQNGALAMTKTSTAPLEGFVPELAVFGIPYLFRDEEHFWKVIESPIGSQLLTAGQSKGLRGLCYYDAGARSFYTTKRPILKPSDLKGLKIRVQQSKMAMDMIEVLGGQPTPIPYGELYTALQSNMVEGAENNTPSFYTNRHFEVCKYLSLDEHARVPDMLLISEIVWKTLSPDVQRILQASADLSLQFQRRLWAEESRQILEAVQKEGVEIHMPDKSAFADQVQSMHQGFQNTPLGELVDRIKSM